VLLFEFKYSERKCYQSPDPDSAAYWKERIGKERDEVLLIGAILIH